jgi:hypothetical protein
MPRLTADDTSWTTRPAVPRNKLGRLDQKGREKRWKDAATKLAPGLKSKAGWLH